PVPTAVRGLIRNLSHNGVIEQGGECRPGQQNKGLQPLVSSYLYFYLIPMLCVGMYSGRSASILRMVVTPKSPSYVFSGLRSFTGVSPFEGAIQTGDMVNICSGRSFTLLFMILV